MAIDASQLSPQIQQYIQEQIKAAQAAKDAASAPKELSPDEKVAAALAAVDAAEQRERPAPGHNDAVVAAIVAYLHAVTDRDVAASQHDENQPAPSTQTAGNADAVPAVEVTAPLAGD